MKELGNNSFEEVIQIIETWHPVWCHFVQEHNILP